jgi:hypothetical protein
VFGITGVVACFATSVDWHCDKMRDGVTNGVDACDSSGELERAESAVDTLDTRDWFRNVRRVPPLLERPRKHN